MTRSNSPIVEITETDAFYIIMHSHEAEDSLYWLKDGEKYVGIDNTTHDAWTEAFDSKEACFDWLRGGDLDDRKVRMAVPR